jgi:hypothetical protein
MPESTFQPNQHSERWKLNMSNAKDTIITNAQDQAVESLKDDAQNKISSTDKDALRDRALDGVAGGTGGGCSTPIGPRVNGG